VSTSRRAIVTGLAAAAVSMVAGCAPSQARGPVDGSGTAGPLVTPDASPTGAPVPTDSPAPDGPSRAEIVARYGSLRPSAWGLQLPGMTGTIPGTGPRLALTFDACGGPGGAGYDAALIGMLRQHSVPATLFLNERWIAANRQTAAELIADPLFEIGNHGTQHRPLSTTGRSAYGIAGTRDAGEVYDEVAGNRALLTTLTGRPPRYFRSGTAYCDDLAVRIVHDLGETPASFAVNGDGGATFTKEQVASTLLAAPPGAVVIAHMNHPTHGTAGGVAIALPRLLARGVTFAHLP
jgi:peptidoglycan/xylan/chitin deacetylase (PgdA/CDA1 family)